MLADQARLHPLLAQELKVLERGAFRDGFVAGILVAALALVTFVFLYRLVA